MASKTVVIEMCDDRCWHCAYIEDGDFFCAAASIPEETIVDWTPKQCVCPDRKEVVK